MRTPPWTTLHALARPGQRVCAARTQGGPCARHRRAHYSNSRTIQMWERAEGTRSGPASDATDLDVAASWLGPDKATRQAALPSVCGTPYCPDSLESGEPCSFSEECKQGSCNSGPCGVPKGVCVP